MLRHFYKLYVVCDKKSIVQNYKYKILYNSLDPLSPYYMATLVIVAIIMYCGLALTRISKGTVTVTWYVP